ncbi:hypothetical protein BD410DRAFT_445143 [Rickenella mellea]|uniref:Uncharacterized protein n=1 Tax=Rickenella mellea TaxID=50990 RepID=A0A4Y7PW72_9AGAM|nr:hypothetical protein BD410DRAFT_445143 [Rickenella mellea]
MPHQNCLILTLKRPVKRVLTNGTSSDREFKLTQPVLIKTPPFCCTRRFMERTYFLLSSSVKTQNEHQPNHPTTRSIVTSLHLTVVRQLNLILTFKVAGYGEGDNRKLEFDLNESARKLRSTICQTLTRVDFSSSSLLKTMPCPQPSISAPRLQPPSPSGRITPRRCNAI